MDEIWCVEDDASIRDIEEYTLKSMGFKARAFSDGAALYKAIGEARALGGALPDLIILDIMLPEEDGVSILKKLKNNPETRDIPVIMATAKSMEYDKIQSLDLGADDYLVKPFGMMEMVSRIRAVLRRCAKGGREETVLKADGAFGEILLNIKERTVSARGERIQLTLKEFDMLALFMAHPGLVFTRDQLFNEIWGADFLGETRTVDVHIRNLRRKLDDCGAYIETVRGVGYKLAVS